MITSAQKSLEAMAVSRGFAVPTITDKAIVLDCTSAHDVSLCRAAQAQAKEQGKELRIEQQGAKPRHFNFGTVTRKLAITPADAP
jgi:hypothetical protein